MCIHFSGTTAIMPKRGLGLYHFLTSGWQNDLGNEGSFSFMTTPLSCLFNNSLDTGHCKFGHEPFKQVFFRPVGAVVLPKISSSVTC